MTEFTIRKSSRLGTYYIFLDEFMNWSSKQDDDAEWYYTLGGIGTYVDYPAVRESPWENLTRCKFIRRLVLRTILFIIFSLVLCSAGLFIAACLISAPYYLISHGCQAAGHGSLFVLAVIGMAMWGLAAIGGLFLGVMCLICAITEKEKACSPVGVID